MDKASRTKMNLVTATAEGQLQAFKRLKDLLKELSRY